MSIITKSQQVQDYLRRAIATDRWSPDERLPGERELVVELGVSNTTLRHALNALTYEGLIVRKPGSGTYVSGQSVRSPYIGVLLKDSQLSCGMGYWYHHLMDELKKQIEASGHNVMMTLGHGDTDEEFVSSINLFDRASSRTLQGLICITHPGSVLNRLENIGIPIVTLRIGYPLGMHSVVLDYQELIKTAVQMLASAGHGDFAVMYEDVPKRSNAPAHKTARQEMLNLLSAAVGYSDERLIPVKYSLDYSNAYDAFKEWWSKPNRPNSIFFSDDAFCDVAIPAILELGIKVPEELSIVTHANIARQFNFPVPLTRIGFDPAETVGACWRILNNLISGVSVDQPIVYIPPHVQMGESLR